MKFVTLLFIIGFVSACTTAPKIVKHTASPKTVTVEYENAGFESSTKQNRKDAIVKASKFCGSEPKFMAEEKITRAEADFKNELENKDYIQLTFACK